MNALKLKILIGILSVFGILLVATIFTKSMLFVVLTGISLLIYFLLMLWLPSASIGEKN